MSKSFVKNLKNMSDAEINDKIIKTNFTTANPNLTRVILEEELKRRKEGIRK